MSEKKQKIQKIIDNKQTFADYAYKEYRSENFGMTSCCASQLEKYSLDNELCEWQTNEKTIYNENTYTFSTWNWTEFLNAPLPNKPIEGAPSWVQKNRPAFSQRRLYGINSAYATDNQPFNDESNWSYNRGVIDATAASNANDFVLTIQDASINTQAANGNMVRDQSYVYALVLRDNTTLAHILNFADVTDPVWRDDFHRHAWSIKPEPTRMDSGSSMHIKMQYAGWDQWWWKFDWIACNPGGTKVPAAGNMTINIRNSDMGGTGGDKNGANKEDFVFLICVNSGQLPGMIQQYVDNGNVPGTNSRINVIGASSGSYFNMTSSANLQTCRFEVGGSASISLSTYENRNATIDPTNDLRGLRAMVSYANVEVTPGPEADYDTCIDDAELLYITVKDKNAAPVKNYDIMIDNTYYGKTDNSGILIVNIKNASTDTKHIINGCKCFTTSGACNQQKIDIVLKEVVEPVCTNLAIDCL